MNAESSYSNATEAVGIFQSADDLQAAVDDLLTQGFNRMDISVMASETAVQDKLRDFYVPARELEDRGGVPTTAFVSTEAFGDAMGAVIGALVYVPAVVGSAVIVASGGTLAAAAAAMAIGGGIGGSFGAIIAALIGKHHSTQIEEQLLAGGLLLWVRTRDKIHEERALAILAGHGGTDVHLHTLPSLAGNGCSLPVEDVVEASSAHADDS